MNDLLTKDDFLKIEEAKASAEKTKAKVWDQESLSLIKKKIKAFRRAENENRCCYCLKNFHGEFNMVIDIEHVLPKAKYPKYEFSMFNLAVACKRCNMDIKGQDLTFLAKSNFSDEDAEDSSAYRIIHPNLDDYHNHLDHILVITNKGKIIKYNVINESEKGSFTYDYFELRKLEIESIDEAQGVALVQRFSSILGKSITSEIENLLTNLGER